jgi:hypothetical protein
MYHSTAAPKTLFVRVLMPSSLGVLCTSVIALLMPMIIVLHAKAGSIPVLQPAVDGVGNAANNPFGFFGETTSTIGRMAGSVVMIAGVIVGCAILYSFVLFLLRLAYRAHEALRPDLRAPAGTVVTRQPFKDFVYRSAWRIVVCLIALAFTLLVVNILRENAQHAGTLRASTGTYESVSYFVLTAVICAAIIHCYVILLRLFVGRTRLFGEILF